MLESLMKDEVSEQDFRRRTTFKREDGEVMVGDVFQKAVEIGQPLKIGKVSVHLSIKSFCTCPFLCLCVCA